MNTNKVSCREKNKSSMRYFAVVVFLTLLVLSVTIFYSGIKNIDLVYNYNQVADRMVDFTNKELMNKNASFQIERINTSDIGSDLIARPLSDYYIIGINQIIRGFFMGLISAFALGGLLNDK